MDRRVKHMNHLLCSIILLTLYTSAVFSYRYRQKNSKTLHQFQKSIKDTSTFYRKPSFRADPVPDPDPSRLSVPKPLPPTLLLFTTVAFLTMVSVFENEKFSLSSINCNSLNMSNSAKWNQQLKICGITKLKTDIIFLSDIRMSNRNLVSSSEDLKRMFLNNPYEKYDMYANSTKNSRGVGILIKHSLCADILNSSCSEDENLLLLHTKIKGTEIVLISIYGPNSNNRDFFTNLGEKLNMYRNLPVLIAGDWNCTFSSSPLATNPDCINMQRLPNALHSNLLSELCENFSLTDPYRFLYPDKIEFTYVPRNDALKNKSRLDFFIISDTLLDFVSKCNIEENLQNKLFDHKAVTLSFNEKKFTYSRNPAISNKELDDSLLDFLVHATVCETFLIHLQHEVPGRLNKQAMLETCGTIKAIIRDCGPPPELITGTDVTIELIETRNRKIDRLQVLKNHLDLNILENLNLTCSYTNFFETLFINVKNETVSHQSFMRKCKLSKISELKNKLQKLKENYIANENEIFTLECRLNKIVDAEMRSAMEKFRNFDIINGEKMTPRFLTLANVSKKHVPLGVVCDDSGAAFQRDEDRNSYIRSFYSNIFNPVQGNEPVQVNEETINNFLGPEICANPIVAGCKLTEEEKTYFDREISIQELDLALNQLNENSAGGADGISTKFLKKFWPYFRVTVYRYMLACFDSKNLTQSTNSAVIKLIPKKGDLSLIKNWRPISLLNCVFKIISKSVDNRLKKINEIILSRSQKGFTSKRYIQECIINIVDSIGICEATNDPAIILALDMAKAFDTVRHDFAREVYRFFGIGDKFANVLCTISTNRTASIMLDDGSLSKPFPLGSGFPQGNNASPNQFNPVMQVLIFKIEFDPRILKITALHTAPPINYDINVQAPARVQEQREIVPAADPAPAEDPAPAQVHIIAIRHRNYGALESNKETGKVEAFADDNTAISKPEPDSIKAISENLTNFAEISGLKCNVNKSMLMMVGNGNLPVPPCVQNSGFQIVDSIKVLGFDITKNYEDLNSNFDDSIKKIKKTARFWERFKLSLPGRINVAKTLMLSQLSYPGSILTPSNAQLQEINSTINGFVCGKLKISKDYIHTGIEKGGLGLIDVCEFLDSLKCSWIKRSLNNTIDNWRFDLKTIGNKNILTLDVGTIQKQSHPLKYNIAGAWTEFKKAFYLRNKNFYFSYLAGNPLLFNNKREKLLLDTGEVFNGVAAPEQVAKLKIHNFFGNNGEFASNAELSNALDMNVPNQNYYALRTAILDSISLQKHKTFETEGIPDQSLEDFLNNFKKGSKPFRKVFEQFRSKKISLSKKQTVKTFFRLIDIEIPEESILASLYKLWGNNCYPNRLREFIFKFLHNQLGLNTRVSHFNNNIARACTFCAIKRRVPAPDETFLHLFYSCPDTSAIFERFFLTKLNDLGLTDEETKKKFLFTGFNPITNTCDNFFLCTLVVNMMQYIWECKLTKTTPSYMGLENFIYYNIETIRRNSNKLREHLLINLAICRNWFNDAQQRR
jgi:exonuclease III